MRLNYIGVVLPVVVVEVACKVARYAPAIITMTIMTTAAMIIDLLTALWLEKWLGFFKGMDFRIWVILINFGRLS